MKIKIQLFLDTETDRDIMLSIDDMSSIKRNRYIKDCIRNSLSTETKIDEILRIIKTSIVSTKRDNIIDKKVDINNKDIEDALSNLGL
jgi:hypothetical protein